MSPIFSIVNVYRVHVLYIIIIKPMHGVVALAVLDLVQTKLWCQ